MGLLIRKKKQMLSTKLTWPTVLDLLFSFNGRITCRDWWIMQICVLIPMAIAYPIKENEQIIRDNFPSFIVNMILLFCIFDLIIGIWICFAAHIKRFHDMGKSGWNSLLVFIPIVGPPYLIWKLGFSNNSILPNKYGPPVR
jgi:uncharacterized membrane protein YhaH (DUF805 family)